MPRRLSVPVRTLATGRRARLLTIEVASGDRRQIHESSTLLFEAPNWSPDGRWLVVNGDGHLFRIDAPNPAGGLEQFDLGGLPPINNDHVISPDGETVYVSADDGHLYAVSFAGGAPRRITRERAPSYHHFLHGVSPDGSTLAYIGLTVNDDGSMTTNVHTIPVSGGVESQLTDDPHPDDGCEYSPDGSWIYFNSERGSSRPGHAQLFRMRPDATGMEQLTHDERVNWFPHPSPDNGTLAYLSYPPGTLGHPPDRDVTIRLCTPDGQDTRDLVALFGGQGTINVPSWSPDSRWLAYVDYPAGS